MKSAIFLFSTLALFIHPLVYPSWGADFFTWKIKRRIGQTVIWSSPGHPSLRGSTRLKDGKSSLANLDKRKEVIKSFEETKRQALAMTGVKDWKAVKYEWSDESLLVKGHYKDRKERVHNFQETHLFGKKQYAIIVLTQKGKSPIEDSMMNSLIQTLKTTESFE